MFTSNTRKRKPTLHNFTAAAAADDLHFINKFVNSSTCEQINFNYKKPVFRFSKQNAILSSLIQMYHRFWLRKDIGDHHHAALTRTTDVWNRRTAAAPQPYCIGQHRHSINTHRFIIRDSTRMQVSNSKMRIKIFNTCFVSLSI